MFPISYVLPDAFQRDLDRASINGCLYESFRHPCDDTEIQSCGHLQTAVDKLNTPSIQMGWRVAGGTRPAILFRPVARGCHHGLGGTLPAKSPPETSQVMGVSSARTITGYGGGAIWRSSRTSLLGACAESGKLSTDVKERGFTGVLGDAIICYIKDVM